MPGQRVRGGRADRHLRDYRRNPSSESKGGRTDRHPREYGRTGGSPYQSTGRRADRHLREYRRNAGSESKGGPADLCLKLDVLIGGSPSQRVRAECWLRVNQGVSKTGEERIKLSFTKVGSGCLKGEKDILRDCKQKLPTQLARLRWLVLALLLFGLLHDTRVVTKFVTSLL